MLRISVENEELVTRLKLEGKLAHEWVSEAAQAWNTLTTTQSAQNVVVDLRDVLFVDDAGRRLLAQMVGAGAKLEGNGPMMNILIEEISAVAESDPLTKAARRSPALFMLLIWSVVFAALAFVFELTNKVWSVAQISQTETFQPANAQQSQVVRKR